jgi:hypothetical protein
MFGAPSIGFGFRYYTLVRFGVVQNRSLGEPVPGPIAAHTVASMMRDEQACRQLRALYTRFTHAFAVAHHTNDEVLRWYQGQLRYASGGLTLLVRDSHAPVTRSKEAATDAQDVREARRIDALLRELGTQDLPHRGSGYRIARGQAQDLRGRSTLEVLGDGEARRVLAELAQVAQRGAKQQGALQELASSFDKLRDTPALQLLVLRRYRTHVRAEGQETVTPSQLRKQKREEHWVEIHLEDSEGKALTGMACEVTLPDGSKLEKVSNDLGYIRVDGVSAAGQCSLSLPELDAKRWNAA